MKKLSLLLLFTFIGITLFAQKTKIGIQIGTNDTTFKSDFPNNNNNNNNNNNSFKLGFLVGANFEYVISNNISLKSGVYYEQRKDEFELDLFLPDGSNPETSKNFKANYNNLDFPLLVKINVTPSKRLFFNGGFTLNYLLKTTVNEGTVNSNLNKLDLNFSIGAGAAFKLKNNDLNIEVRYNPYLFNVVKNYPNDDLKMTPLNLIVFWNFDL